MKLPSAGTRLLNGNMGGMDSTGFYWAPEASETAKYINFNVSATAIKNDKRAYGMPIRCIWATDEEIDGITFGVSIGGKITYDFENIPADTDVKIRIKAQMYKTGTPGWDVRVVDNTNRRSLNIVETTLFNTGASQKIKYIYFPSGWGKYSYITPRVAAPFAILDTTYKCMQLVLSADPSTVFPLLKVNWSELNNISIGHYDRGDIGSSQYKDGQLYILGKADKDTDEYDAPVIAYEWGMLLSRQVLLF
ncbi:MAG: hypothetical protein LGB53_00985 [Sulfurovum sp.]|nr:hypothetical protein [Sulfurovum sp.]MCB4784453.1 hypothetical protein [Sulfurovum sp.]